MSSQAVVPRRSRRLATFIPASYWISMGYSQDDAQAMEKLQNDMKKYCDVSENNDVILKGRGGDGLPYHDLMLPHWKKLFKALHGRTSINEFTLIGVSLPSVVLDIMFPALQSINLEEFGISSVGLGTDEFVKLSSFIKDSTSIKTLCIGGDTINDMSVASSLSDAVKGHPTFQTLVLVKSGLNNAHILGKVLEGCSGLNELRLIGHEKLGMEGVALVADFIRCNHPMKVIHLQRNKISDYDTLVLASALKQNKNLSRLNLQNNNDITEEGNKNLLAALYEPTSMDSIIASNHTCMAYSYDLRNTSIVAQRPPIEIEVFRINKGDYTIGQKIRKKVVLALCRQDGELFDLSHFNDLPLRLMPRVLELIQEHTIGRTLAYKSTPIQLEKDALTRLFHTLRGWELPLLFENLGSPSAERGGKKRKRRKTRR